MAYTKEQIEQAKAELQRRQSVAGPTGNEAQSGQTGYKMPSFSSGIASSFSRKTEIKSLKTIPSEIDGERLQSLMHEEDVQNARDEMRRRQNERNEQLYRQASDDVKQKMAATNPLGTAAMNTVGQIGQGIGRTLGGLWGAGGEAFQGRPDRAMGKIGESIGGLAQIAGAPFSGPAETVVSMLPREGRQAAEVAFNAPNVLIGNSAKFIIGQLAKSQGKNFNPDDPNFEEQVVKPLQNIFGLYMAKKGYEAPKTTTKLKGAGESLYEAAIKPTVKEAEMSQRFEAGVSPLKPRTTAQTALEKGLTGTEKTLGTKAQSVQSSLWKEKIKPAVESIQEPLPKAKVFSDIESFINKTKEPGRKAALQDAFEALKEDYKGVGDLKYSEWQEIKSGLDQFAQSKQFRGKEVASEYNQLRHEMANSVRKNTYERLKDQNIKQDYLDYGNLENLKELGIRARTQADLRSAAGRSIAALWDKFAIPITTKAGQTLYRLGDGLEFFAPIRRAKFTLGAYLKTLGMDREEFNRRMNVKKKK